MVRAPGADWVEDLRSTDIPVSTGGGYCSIDCTRVVTMTPALLHHLALVNERSVGAGLPVRLVGASPALEQVFAVLAPGSAACPSAANSLIDARGGLMQVSDEGVRQATASLMAYLKRMQVPDLTAYVLRTLFEEVATNSKLHARLPQNAELFWHLQLAPHKSVLLFADGGDPFDPTVWDSESGPIEREPGDDRPPFGIRLIRSLAQRLEYQRINDQLNVLVLERDRR